MKRILDKFHRDDGMSLAETLVAVLILLMVSAVVAAGIPAAASAYTKAVDAANAQVLLSTTINALRGELSTAWNLETDTAQITGEGGSVQTTESKNTAISFMSARTGSRCKIYLGPENAGTSGTGGSDDGEGSGSEQAGSDSIWITEYSDRGEGGVLDSGAEYIDGSSRLLVSAAAKTDMTVSYDSIALSTNKAIVTISGLKVMKGDRIMADMPDVGLIIHVLTKEKDS